jgi:hypothetical protein
MQGILTFSTLEEAMRYGFSLYDRTSSGYLVRMKTAGGWALAVVRTEEA